MHHVMSDGMGFVAFMANLVDEYDPKMLPAMKRFTLLDRLMIYATIPYYFLRMTITFLLYKPDRNPF